MSENGDDIVARLERLATKMFQSGNWGRDLDTVKEAMDTIVDLRVDLHRIEELEAKLATCEKYRDAYDKMGRIGTEAYRDLEAKLAKLAHAAKPFAAIKIKDGRSQAGEIGRTDVTNIRAALAELKGQDDE